MCQRYNQELCISSRTTLVTKKGNSNRCRMEFEKIRRRNSLVVEKGTVLGIASISAVTSSVRKTRSSVGGDLTDKHQQDGDNLTVWVKETYRMVWAFRGIITEENIEKTWRYQKLVDRNNSIKDEGEEREVGELGWVCLNNRRKDEDGEKKWVNWVGFGLFE